MSTIVITIAAIIVALPLCMYWRRAYRRANKQYLQLRDSYYRLIPEPFSKIWFFSIDRTPTAYEIIGKCTSASGVTRDIIIKRFPFNAEDMDSVNFAKLLAEELIEKLLEK